MQEEAVEEEDYTDQDLQEAEDTWSNGVESNRVQSAEYDTS